MTEKQWVMSAVAGMVLCLLLSCNSGSINLQKLDLQDLDGNPANMDAYEGKPLFLNFWATWCGPCVKEMPGIAKAREELEKAGFDYQFVFVSDETKENLKHFAMNRNYGFDFYQLQGSIKAKGVFSIPQTYIFDQSGQVVHSHTGYADWGDAQHVELLKNLAR